MRFQMNERKTIKDTDFGWGRSCGFYPEHMDKKNPIIVHLVRFNKHYELVPNELYVYAPYAEPDEWNKGWNFHSNRYNTLKIMNLVGRGHYVELYVPDGHYFSIGLPDQFLKETEWMSSIKYLLENDKPLYGYKEIFPQLFSDEEAALEYFDSDAYEHELMDADRQKVLGNLVMQTLAEVKAHFIENNLFESYRIIEKTFNDLGIDVHDPAQTIAPLTVQPHKTKTILPQLKFYGELKGSKVEWQGAYYQVEDSYRYDVKPVHELESKGVNTWLYQHQLHEPTLEEKQARFAELETMIQDIKSISDPRKKAKEVSRFARVHLDEYDRLDYELKGYEEPHGNIDTMEEEELA